MLSFVVALVAAGLSYQAWTRPYPADPTQIPTYGTPAAPIVVGPPGSARGLFDFIEKNAGRKVRLNVQLDPKYYALSGVDANGPNRSYFAATMEGCADGPISGRDPLSCPMNLLEILELDEDGRVGLYLQQGTWRLSGYFASNGYVSIYSGYNLYSVIPLKPIEAVT
ncbi:MAG: hypothetical protein ACQEXM_18290 [Actinomycetota bacterium]